MKTESKVKYLVAPGYLPARSINRVKGTLGRHFQLSDTETTTLRNGKRALYCLRKIGNKGEIKLRIDQIHIRSKPEVRYVELRITGGSKRLIRGVQRELEELPDLIPTRLSKSSRNHLPKHISPDPVGIAPAYIELILADHLLANLIDLAHLEAYAYESVSPEGIHLMRVCIRRLRAATYLSSAVIGQDAVKEVSDRLHHFIRLLGVVRDFDVVAITYTDNEEFSEILRQGRKKAHAKLRRHMDGSMLEKLRNAVVRLINDLRAMAVTRASAENIHSLLTPMIGSVMHRGQQITTLPDTKLHKLRIAAKRLRYQLEVFMGYPELELVALHNDLSKLQDILGELHDLDLAPMLVKKSTGKKVGRRELQGDTSVVERDLRAELPALWGKVRSSALSLTE